jgi:nucleoside-diphosphate-sugar epimerase
MNVLVTGCAGFIGSNIAEKLIGSKGFNVYGVDNFITGLPENIQHLDTKMSFIRGDLRDHKTAMRVTRGIDVVCHQAALPSVPRSVDDPITSNDHNVNATLSLLNACVANNVKKIVYASSSSVYGDNKIMPRKEDLLPMPKSPYAVSKLTGEYYLRAFSSTYGIDSITLRYFNVFGARQNPKSQYAAVIPKFMVAAINGDPITIYGNGKQTRDFSYIDNVVNANILAILSDRELKGEVVNIACGKKYSLLKMIDILNDITGGKVKVNFEEPRVGDVMDSLADIRRAKKVIGYVPEVDFIDGMKRTFKYYKGWVNGKRT